MARYRRPLVIAVYDPRWFIKVLGILKKRRIPYTLYYDSSDLPNYSILYTDYEYYAVNIPEDKMIDVYYDPEHNCRILEEAILASMFKKKYTNITVGVDPGPNPYLVVLGDDSIIDYRYIRGEELVEYLEGINSCYPVDKLTVRVGGGTKGLEIALYIKEKIPSLHVELVDEEETTPGRNRSRDELTHISNGLIKPFRNKDAYAALRIALRKGIELVK